MPVPLTDEERATLASGALAIRTLVDFHFDSGRVSFWDGDAPYTIGGQEYLPIGDYGEIGEISMGADLGAEGVELKLNGTKLIEDSPDLTDPGALFGEIEDETYQMRRVDIRFAFFSTTTGALVFSVKRYAGLIDQIRQVEELSDAMDRAEEWLIVALESVARRYGQRNGRTRSNEDQQAIFPGDEFFLFTSPSVARQGSLTWGRASSSGVNSTVGADAPYGFGLVRRPPGLPNVG